MNEHLTPGYYWARWAGDDESMPFIADIVDVDIEGRRIYEAYRTGDDVPFPISSIVILAGPLEEPE